MKAATFSIALLLGSATALHAAPPVVIPSFPVAGTHTCSYPDAAQRDDVQGDVLVRYDVAADGRITNVVLVKSSGSSVLDKTALGCVSTRWKNTPATQDGIKIASPNHTARVSFKLPPGVPKEVFRIILALVILVVLACVVFWRRDPPAI